MPTISGTINAILSSKKVHTHTIIDNYTSNTRMIITKEPNNFLSHEDILI